MFGKRTTPVYYAIVKSLRKAAIERLRHSKASYLDSNARLVTMEKVWRI
jgi:hypothetical protein